MAEDNTPFSSLDPLGPEFGRINQPILDIKGLSPFEGDRMSLPEINTPSYFPVIPSASSLDRPDQGIRDNIVGSPIQRSPKIGSNQPVPSAKDFNKAFKAYVKARQSTAQPQDQYAKIYSYDASNASNTFYDRYAAYGQEKFDQIGFHPLRDNEALYNAKTTGWNDFTRMMSNSFWPLFSRGFVSGPKSLYKMMQGDFSADTEDALAYERAAAIGQSTKGGFGAFMNNTFMNFGYTAGIVSEAILEEVAGAALAPLTGGGSFFAATANNARKLDNIVGGLNMVRGAAQAENLTQGAYAFNKTLDSLNSLQNVRRLFESAKTEKFLTTGVGGWINPLSNLTESIYKSARNADNLTGMARLASTMGKTAGGLYRDVRNINMALAEARLEGGFVENKVYQDLYDDYYRANKQAPDNQLLYDMRKQAKEAAATTMMWNTALIYGSNKITFGNIMNPNGGIRKMIGAKTADILDYKYGKVVFEKASKKAAKEAGDETSKAALKGQFKFIDKSFKNWAKGLTKDPLSKSVIKTVGYFKANFAEGIQENLQEVIARASEKYYIDSFKNPALANHLYAKGLAQAAIDEQFSAKGFETFASGFFMGMFAGPLNSALPAMSIGYNKYFNTPEYQKYKETKDNVQKAVVNKLNALGQDPKEFFDSRLFNYATQDTVAGKINDSDTKIKMDMKEEAFISQITSALDTNTFNYFIDHINSFKEYTPEEFEEAFGLEKGKGQEYQSRIDGIVSKAKTLKETYDEFNERMPSPVNFTGLEQGTEDYNKAAIYDAAWREGRKNYVFFNQNFKDVTKRMRDVNQKFAERLSKNARGKIPVTDTQVLFESERMLNEIDMLKSEIETLEASTNPSDKRRIADKRKKLESLQAVSDAMSNKQIFDIDIEPIIKEQINAYKEFMKESGQPVPTDEELDVLIRKEIKAQNIGADKSYEDSVKKYLKTLAESNGDVLFDSDFEEAFQSLKDYNKLDIEAKGLAKSVNMLHNPTEFYLHVERNYQWMSDLYNNRKQYYDSLVNQTIEDIELNAILNALAAQNVYININDLIAFKTTGVLPKEFYDATRKMVIKETSPEYDRYANLFIMALQAKAEETKPTSYDEQLQDKLDALNKEEQEKIDALPKVSVREGDESLPFGKNKTISIKVVNDNLNDGEYAELTYNVKGGTRSITVYKDGNTLKYDNEDGDDVNLKDLKERFTKATKYRITFKPDPEAAKLIRDEYAIKRADLINTYAEKGAGQGPLKEFVPFTKDTPLDEMDEDLVNQLRVAFQTYLENNLDIMEELAEVTDDVFQERFESFIRTQPEAIDTIDQYNRNKQLAIIAGETSVAKAPVITVGNVTVDFATLTPQKIKDELNRFRSRLAEYAEKESKGTITPKEREYQAIIRLNIPKIEAYLNAISKAQNTPAFQETLNKLQAVYDAQAFVSKQGEQYYIAYDKVLRRVTTAIRDLIPDKYEYMSKESVQLAYNTSILVRNEKVDAIEQFVQKLKSEIGNKPYRSHGLNSKAYIKIEEELRKYPIEELTFDKVLDIVSEKSYEAATEAGNYIDSQIRNLFSLNPKDSVEFDSSKITKEAFDSLFGPEGYLTALRKKVDQGEIYVISKGFRLFDLDSGVAGEPDLIVIDKTTGSLSIVDVKTGKEDKWKNFNNPKSIYYNKNVEYSFQQHAYRNLLYNLTGIKANIGILPIEVELDTEENKILKAYRPASLAAGKSTFELVRSTQEKKDSKGKVIKKAELIQDLINTIIPPVSPKIKVATEINPELRTQLNQMGYSNSIIDTLSKAEIERIVKEGIAVEDYVPIEEPQAGGDQESVASKLAKESITQTRTKNVQAINRKIEVLREKRVLMGKDITTVKDTLEFLDKILETATESAGIEVDALLNRIVGLEKVANTLIKSKQRKKGEEIQFRADEVRAQIKREFRTANDILNRVRELREELNQLEAIQKDLSNQESYYRNLIQDKNFKTLSQTELLDKVDKIQKKMSTIEKLIKAIKSAIAKSIDYLKEYLSVWRGVYSETKAFERETGFRTLTRDELANLIKSTSEADKIKLDQYGDLRSKYNSLMDRINKSMDDVEFSEEVLSNEETRLDQLINKLKTYDDQIRYISDIFDDVTDDVFMDQNLSDQGVTSPKPDATYTQAGNTNTRITNAQNQKKDAEDEILSEFILEGEDLKVPDSQLLIDYLTRINDARGLDDIQEINASLSKFNYKLTADDVLRISQAIKSRIEVLKSDPTAVPTTANNLKNGDQLIVKNAIFINKKLFASKLDTLHVTEVNNDGASVINLRTKQPEKLTFADLNNNAMLKDAAENVQETPPVELTNDEKALVNTANTSIIDFINDPELKKEAEDYADAKSLNELEDEMFDTNICD